MKLTGCCAMLALFFGMGGCGSSGMSTQGTGGSSGSTGTGGAAGHGGSGGSGGATGNGGATGSGGSTTDACALFTTDDPWNADVSGKTADAAMTAKLQGLLGAINIHPDFGSDFGIPINVVPQSQTPLPVTFTAYPGESDPGPYPFPGPSTAVVEGTSDPTSCSGDCHLIAVQQGVCQLYEGYACHYSGSGWSCANGAHWDLTKLSLGQRMPGWTSADAAGLSIYAGLARYAEVAAGEITHAIRYTVPCTAGSYVSPATHEAVPSKAGCDTDPNAVPMGLRVRLKASFDISGFPATAQVFLRAFKKHGLILADNGGSSSGFFFQSEQNASWSDSDINSLKNVPVSAFEAVDP